MHDLPKSHSGWRQTSPPLKHLSFHQSLKPSVHFHGGSDTGWATARHMLARAIRDLASCSHSSLNLGCPLITVPRLPGVERT